jgi:methionine-rich copper-binding protein CopC
LTTVQSDHEENGCTPVPDCDNDHDVEESSTQIALCENSISQTNVSETNVTQTSGRRDLIAYTSIQDQQNGKMKIKLPADEVIIDLTKEIYNSNEK